MDIDINPSLFDKKIDPKNGNILFHRKDMRGLPDKVVDGDGFTVEFKDGQIYLIDIFNSAKVLKTLLATLDVEKIA